LEVVEGWAEGCVNLGIFFKIKIKIGWKEGGSEGEEEEEEEEVGGCFAGSSVVTGVWGSFVADRLRAGGGGGGCGFVATTAHGFQADPQGA